MRAKLPRIAVLGGLLLLVANGLVWGGHVYWRSQGMEELWAVRAQIDTLATQLDEDDHWVETRARLMEEYSQHQEFAARLAARGRRARAYTMLVAAYNERVSYLYRRFYLAPLPAPEPPVIQHRDSP